MNQLFNKNFKSVALVMTFFFTTALIASPAFSHDGRRHFSQPHHGSHHVRIFPDGDILPALLVGGIVAGITFGLIESAANPPVHEYRAPSRRYAPAFAPDPRAPYVSTGSVMVTAQLLNVRTGPSLEEPSIRQIPYGTILSIHGSSPGWYYVNLNGDQYGWIMVQYTTPLGYSGDG